MSLVRLPCVLALFLGLAPLQGACATAEQAIPHNARVDAEALSVRSGFSAAFTTQCGPERPPGAGAGRPSAITPTQIFDNLYFVGLDSVGTFVITTSQGLILIDALNNSAEAETVLVPGLVELGLSPSDIRYIIVTHGHGDHYGGAQWLADTYGARVIASEADWAFMEAGATRALPANWSPAPKRDLTAFDGQSLTLGDTAVGLHLTPGHTPGTVSLIFAVYDRGERHLAALWGGTAYPRDRTRIPTYLTSIDKFSDLVTSQGVDVELSSHPLIDGSLERLAAVRRGERPNPFILTTGKVQDFLGIFRACGEVRQASPPLERP